MANIVSEEQLRDASRIQNNPCCFQEYIPKAYEVRLTVIGQKLFPVAIYSQGSDYSKVDFRRYDFENVAYEHVDLPEDTAKRISSLIQSYGLEYAAVDLIRTPDGEYVFLEVNPNGQYLWTEEQSGAPITEAFADLLTGVAA